MKLHRFPLWVLLLLLVALSGCATTSQGTIGNTPQASPIPVTASTSPTMAKWTPSPATLLLQVTVVSVLDGDTIEVNMGGQTGRVRLIGVDTPEVYGQEECFGQAASAFTKSLLPAGASIGLEKDVSERDRYGRLLRYVYLPDGRMLNEVLVAEGYAQVATFPPDVKYQGRFLMAQREARQGGRGPLGGLAWVPQPPRYLAQPLPRLLLVLPLQIAPLDSGPTSRYCMIPLDPTGIALTLAPGPRLRIFTRQLEVQPATATAWMQIETV